MAVPTRTTDQREVDQWNAEMRQSPVYLQYMQSQGLPTDGRVKLSKQQQEGLERALAQAGTPIPSGMHIDQGGNLNQKNRLVRNTAIAAGVAAGGYFAAPYIAGALASGAGGGAAAGGAGAVGGGTAGASGAGLYGGLFAPAGLVGTGTAATGAGLGTAAGVGTAAGGASLGKALGWLGGNWRDAAGMAGDALGAYGQAKTSNREAEFSGQYDLERLLQQRDRDAWDQTLEREQEGRASGTDAWTKLLAAQRILSPAERPRTGSKYAGPRYATEAELTGADAMTVEVMKRLEGGNPIAPVTPRPMNVDPNLLRPGRTEQITGWLSPVVRGVGAYYGRPPVSTTQPVGRR